jgi:hypothetical protein
MTWAQRTLNKARSMHTEIAELIRFLNAEGKDVATAGHLFDGHYSALDELYLERMQIAVALDQSDLVLQYHGPLVKHGFCPLSRMHRLFDNLRKELVHVTKTHPNLSAKSFRWKGDMDLDVTIANPKLIFGFRVPNPEDADDEAQQLRGFADPLFQAVKDSMELMGVVSASLQDERPRERIDDFARGRPMIDVALVDAALHAARRFIPLKEPKIESVEVGGKMVPDGHPLDMGKEEWSRATEALKETRIPEDIAEVRGSLMAVDYETMRFELRAIQDYQVRSVRCQYRPEHEEIVKTHGKKRVWAKGLAEFDRDQNPRYLIVDELKPVE